jgi:DNA polymerase-3 subunit delta
LKIPHKQLQRHLRGELAAAYLVAGDEPLLLGEALEDIREAARKAGFEERELHVVDRGFRWDELEGSADNLSLFALRKLVELRLASPRPGEAGARSLRRLVARPDPDRLLLVGISAKLDAATAKSAWVKAFEEAGGLVEVWPVERPELPRWVEERAAKHRLKLTRGAAEALAERVEGNLLAADQELRKLALTDVGREIDEAAILEAVANSARFDVFRLTDAVLAGDAGRALRVLAGLRAEGVQPVLVSWALSRELGLLTKLKFALSGGERVEAVFARHGVWRRRQSLVAGALKRYQWEGLKLLLTQTVEVDALVKGGIGERPWDALARLVIAMLNAQAPARRGAA